MKTLVKGFSFVALLSHMNASYAENMLYGEAVIATINQQKPGVYKVQTGVYANHDNATKELERLKRRYNYPISITQAHSGKLSIVTVGPINVGQESPVASQVTQSPSNSGMSLGVMGNPIGPWSPRINGQAWLGNQQGAGYIDSMIPVAGTNHFLWYVDGVYGQGVNKRMLASVGSGVRQLISNQSNEVILGAFVFGDYTKSLNNTQAWLINPGIEALTSHYEARLQASIPASHREQAYQATMASEIPSAVLADSGQSLEAYAKAVGHTVTDTPVALTQEYGRGVEAQVGKYFDFMQGTWLRAGAYYYDYKRAKSITGFEANLEVYTNRNVSLLIKDNYDSQKKNNAVIGFRILMGGPNNREVEQLANRMEEPVNRHIARDTFGEAIPTRQSFIQTGPSQTLSNVWFFSPEGQAPAGNTTTLANCTAENPCSNLDQATVAAINTIEPNANFFFNTGTYNIIQGQGFLPQDRWVNLFDGQSFWGRTDNFSQAATGDNRPLINGGLFWGDNSDIARKNATGTVNNLQINNQNQVIPGSFTATSNSVIGIGGTGTIVVNNSVVTVDANAGGAGTEALGVFAPNGVTNVTNSTVTVSNNSANSTTAYGVSNFYGSANVTNSIIRVSAKNTGSGSASALGVYADGGVVSVKNSSVTVDATSPSAKGEAYGIYGYSYSNGDIASVYNSTIIVSVDAYKASAYGVYASGSNGGGAANATNSIVTVSANSDLNFANAYGVYNGSYFTSGGTANAINSFITVSSSGASFIAAYGVIAENGAANTTNSTLMISATSLTNAYAYGVYGLNSGQVINTSINVNASGNGPLDTAICAGGSTSSDGSCT